VTPRDVSRPSDTEPIQRFLIDVANSPPFAILSEISPRTLRRDTPRCRFSSDAADGDALTAGLQNPHIGQLSEAERKKAVLDAVAERFGDKARSPVDYVEQNWAVERYSGGGMVSHTPPGVLTEFGPALREPCGRIHWAGTETSAIMYGFIDGVVRSGERAATEVMKREAMTVA
jgi:monoamine oxidase